MKRAIIYLCLVIPIIANAQNYCDSLFYKLDPVYISLNTQKLVINQVLQCHYALGAADTFSLYDQYFNGVLSDNASEVEKIFFDILHEYVTEYPEQEWLVDLNLISKSTRRGVGYSYENFNPGIYSGNSNSKFVDDQVNRLTGNITDNYFINDIETIPDSVSQLIDDFAARKIAYLQARDGENIFDQMNQHQDSLQFLFQNLDLALIDPRMNLSPLFNRHMNYYIYIFADTITQISQNHINPSLTAIANSDTTFVLAIDSAGIKASNAYEKYRNTEMLMVAQAMNLLSQNTELNLSDLQCIQDLLDQKSNNLDLSIQNLQSSPNPLGESENVNNAIQEVDQTNNIIDLYLSGNLKLSAISSIIGNEICPSGIQVNTLVAHIQARPDMPSLSKYVRLSNSFSNDIKSAKFGSTFAVSAASAAALFTVARFSLFLSDRRKAKKAQKALIKTLGLGESFLKGPKKSLKATAKKRIKNIRKIFTSKNASKFLKRAFPKGVKMLMKSGIQSYLLELYVKDLLDETVTKPILGALNALRKEMNARFDYIDQTLDEIINLQIQTTKAILDAIQSNREFIQYNFNQVNYQLSEILDNQHQIQSDLQNLLLTSTGLNHCKSNLEVINSINPIEKYDDLELAFTNSFTLPSCISGLTDALVNNIDCGNMAFFRAHNTGSTYALHEIENFKKITTLFNFIYDSKLDILYDATQLLLLESDHTIDNQWDLSKTQNLSYDFSLDPLIVLDINNYIDANSVATIMQYYDTFLPFLEVFTSSTNLNPLPIDDYLSLSSIAKAFRLAFLTLYSGNLQCIGRMAKAQQSLMSGSLLVNPMYQIIYDGKYNNETLTYNGQPFNVKRFCIDILQNNATLSSNFITLAMNRNFDFTPVKYFVKNGDFNLEDSLFYTPLTHTQMRSDENQFSIVSSAYQWWNALVDFPEPSGDPNGKYLVADPNYLSTPQTIWKQDIPLKTGDYQFNISLAEGYGPGATAGSYDLSLCDNDFGNTLCPGSISYEFYDVAASPTVDNIPDTNPLSTGIISNFNVTDLQQKLTPADGNTFAVRYSGYIHIPGYSSEAFPYTFSLDSDDGAVLTIDDQFILNHDGQNALGSPVSGTFEILGGPRKFVLEYFQNYGGKGLSLNVSYEGNTTDFFLAFPVSCGCETYPYGSSGPGGQWNNISKDLQVSNSDTFSLKIIDRTTLPGANNLCIDDIIIKNKNSILELSPFSTNVAEGTWEGYSLFKSLDFELVSDPALTNSYFYLRINANVPECDPANNPIPQITCSTLLPIPDLENLKNDKFIFTESYSKMKSILNKITEIHVNTTIPKFYPTDDWYKSMMTKAILVNKSNQ